MKTATAKKQSANSNQKHDDRFTLTTLPSFEAFPTHVIKEMRKAQSEFESYRYILGISCLLAGLDKEAFIAKCRDGLTNGGQETIIELYEKLHAWSETFKGIGDVMEIIEARLLLVGDLLVDEMNKEAA